MNVSIYRGLLCAVVLALAGRAAAEDQAQAPSKFRFELHGFVTASLYGQDANMAVNGGGQSALYVTKQYPSDKLSLGGDVRQTRLNFSLAGPQILGGATPKGVVEVDFFGGDSGGVFGDTSVIPRLRLAYLELNWGGNTIFRAGQDYQLVLGIVPETVGHCAFSLAYTAGLLGWRYPGAEVFQIVPVGGSKIELALQVQRGAWATSQTTVTTPSGTTTIPNNAALDLGSASGVPQVEARAKLKSQAFEAFVAGHYSRVDTNGPGVPGGPQLDVMAGNGGAKIKVADFTLQGSGFYGKNLLPIFGESLATPSTEGIGTDVVEYGGWGQAGYNLTSQLSAWAMVGISHLNYADAAAAGIDRVRNIVGSGMLRYATGGFAVAMEYAHWFTTYRSFSTVQEGNQLMASAAYNF
ncbi:MAG TPA: hypothetical protein VMK12_15320 [Anaeromyxobacteraceae bacterium]|nr:hypothetical protein [Anaeromyxobacteraceae bacterium]